MGQYCHHAIVVTSMHPSLIEAAQVKAFALGMSVSPIIDSPVNGFQSFLVGSDGSKEGWPESNAGDSQRDDFVQWLYEQRHDDDSTSLHWVEVRYADSEDHNAEVVRDGEAWLRLRKMCDHGAELDDA